MKNYTFTDEQGNVVKAASYKAAAEKLYCQQYYHNPACVNDDGAKIPTVYIDRHSGYAEIRVYQIGDKQGSFWGISAAAPTHHRLTTTKKLKGSTNLKKQLTNFMTNTNT